MLPDGCSVLARMARLGAGCIAVFGSGLRLLQRLVTALEAAQSGPFPGKDALQRATVHAKGLERQRRRLAISFCRVADASASSICLGMPHSLIRTNCTIKTKTHNHFFCSDAISSSSCPLTQSPKLPQREPTRARVREVRESEQLSMPVFAKALGITRQRLGSCCYMAARRPLPGEKDR